MLSAVIAEQKRRGKKLSAESSRKQGVEADEVRKQRRLCAIYPFNDLAFLLINFRFEPRLCEPQSPFPGNGILPAETKAPKRRLRFEWPSAETTRAHGSPLIRGYSQ